VIADEKRYGCAKFPVVGSPKLETSASAEFTVTGIGVTYPPDGAPFPAELYPETSARPQPDGSQNPVNLHRSAEQVTNSYHHHSLSPLSL